ncbi:Very short patch repair protein [subsurface metagenome]
MTDSVSREVRRKTMQAIKSKNTKLEERVSKELRKRGIRFRKNVNSLKGKPDIAIKKYKLVIFLDSCFWHGCKKHCRYPKTNKDYWISKIEKNKERDQKITNYYIKKGWNILRIWEHDLKKNFINTIIKIQDFIFQTLKKNST